MGAVHQHGVPGPSAQGRREGGEVRGEGEGEEGGEEGRRGGQTGQGEEGDEDAGAEGEEGSSGDACRRSRGRTEPRHLPAAPAVSLLPPRLRGRLWTRSGVPAGTRGRPGRLHNVPGAGELPRPCRFAPP